MNDRESMNPLDAEATLALAAQRREEAVIEGTTRWSGRYTWTICCSLLALGVLIDADMIWLGAVLMVLGLGVAFNRGVRLKNHPASRGWTAALAGTFVLALGANVVGQFAGRALDLPIPATIGMVLAALVIVFISRPVHARYAASRR